MPIVMMKRLSSLSVQPAFIVTNPDPWRLYESMLDPHMISTVVLFGITYIHWFGACSFIQWLVEFISLTLHNVSSVGFRCKIATSHWVLLVNVLKVGDISHKNCVGWNIWHHFTSSVVTVAKCSRWLSTARYSVDVTMYECCYD